MKTLTALFVCLLFACTATAQGVVKGQINDNANEGVPSANVFVINPKDSSNVKIGVTNLEGKFEIAGVPAGTYFVAVSMVGFKKTYAAPFTVTAGQTVTLAPITLAEDAQMMKEVVVTGQKPMIELQADKTVVNVAASATAIGKDAMELLQKSPGVVVDQNDNILVQGKNGVRIYIDGKPSPLSATDLAAYLRTLQASDIETIEIITNPSSKYDAAGNAGIINIRLKKNENFGTNGSATLGANYGVYGKGNASLNLNNRNKKTNLFANVSGFSGKNWNRQTFHREIAGSDYYQNAISVFNVNSVFNFKTGADYYLNNKSTVGVVVSGNFFDGGPNNSSSTDIYANGSNSVTSILRAGSTGSRTRKNVSANANYRFNDGKGKELSLDLDYALFDNTNKFYQPNSYLSPDGSQTQTERNYQNNTFTYIDIYTAKADYEQNFAGGKLGAGLKLSYVTTDNDFKFYNVIGGEQQLDNNYSNRFKYDENINAAYLNFKKQHKKLSYQIGLRAEQTNSVGTLTATSAQDEDRVERHYLNFFPSAGLTYTAGKNHTFSLVYSRRIDRPNYQDLNPFEFRLDELTRGKGNPFLRPQYTNSVQLTHSFHNMLNTSVGYSVTDNFFAQIIDSLSNGNTVMIQKNLATRETYNFTVGTPIPAAKWWNIYLNVNAFHSVYNANFGEGQVINIKQTSVTMNQQHTFSLPRGIKLEVTGYYNSPGVWGGTLRTKSQWGVDMGMTKKFMKDKLTTRVSVSDIFYTMPWRATSNFAGVYFKGSGAWESQQVRVNFTYNFGNNKVRSKQRQTGSQEENQRLGGGQQ